MGLSSSTGRHLTLSKPFAVFGQLLERFGAVSLLQRLSGGEVAVGYGSCNPVSAVKSLCSLGADCLISA